MAGVDTLTQASYLSDLDQPEMPFGFYRVKSPPGEEKGGTTMTPVTAKICDEDGQKEVGDDHGGK